MPGAGRSNPVLRRIQAARGEPGLRPARRQHGRRALRGFARRPSENSARVYLADFPWNKEFELMCPANRLGTADFLLVSRHGQHSSNSELLVHALRPRVAVMNNGIRKGGQPETMRVLYSSPGFEDLWQLHVAQLSGRGVRHRGNIRCECRRGPRSQRGALDQGGGAGRRGVHGHEQPQRLQQDL